MIWTPAQPDDAASLLKLMGEFYAEEQLHFEPEPLGAALGELLRNQPHLGLVYVLIEEGRTRKGPLGYLVLTVGYSLEFHGRYVTLDELYLRPELRGKGLGGQALEFAAEQAKQELNSTTLRLEVTNHNPRARALYERHQFHDDVRGSMTRWL